MPKKFPPPEEKVFTSKYIDDFNDGALPNLLGGKMSVETEAPSEISFSYDKREALDNKGYCLKVKYRLYPQKTAELIIGLNDIDISQAYGISFWIKNCNGPQIEVLLKDGLDTAGKVILDDRLIEEKTWQKISLMRGDFPKLDFNRLKELRLIFSSADRFIEGELYLDEFFFFGPSHVFFESIKDNLYGFPTKRLLDSHVLLRYSDEKLLRTIASDT
ncbi:MAG: hypothetical protein AB7E08_00170, partial [Candidatus Omnitrophota bacterium]